MLSFSIAAHDRTSLARCGSLQLARGTVRTPAFMPVGTLATVKGLTPRDLQDVDADIILGNTYHLMLRPGAEVVREFGGIPNFMAWPGPVLTDSGGFQVFSLSQRRKLTEEGVTFKSHIDGSSVHLSPESCMDIQMALNADIIMALDECPPAEASREVMAESLARTHRWAARCQDSKRMAEYDPSHLNNRLCDDIYGAGCSADFVDPLPKRECPQLKEDEASSQPQTLKGSVPNRGRERWISPFLRPVQQNLFPIVQGGTHLDMRTESAQVLTELNAPGYAIGGVSVGEGPEAMRAVVTHTTPLLPSEKPRYLMGVGHPRDLLMAIGAGVDMFDCVMPTRNGRNAHAFTSEGVVKLRNLKHRSDPAPLDPDCDCYTCRHFGRGYLRHLFIAGEMLACQLASLHNVRFLLRLMENSRAAIQAGNFSSFARDTLNRLGMSEG